MRAKVEARNQGFEIRSFLGAVAIDDGQVRVGRRLAAEAGEGLDQQVMRLELDQPPHGQQPQRPVAAVEAAGLAVPEEAVVHAVGQQVDAVLGDAARYHLVAQVIRHGGEGRVGALCKDIQHVVGVIGLVAQHEHVDAVAHGDGGDRVAKAADAVGPFPFVQREMPDHRVGAQPVEDVAIDKPRDGFGMVGPVDLDRLGEGAFLGQFRVFEQDEVVGIGQRVKLVDQIVDEGFRGRREHRDHMQDRPACALFAAVEDRVDARQVIGQRAALGLDLEAACTEAQQIGQPDQIAQDRACRLAARDAEIRALAQAIGHIGGQRPDQRGIAQMPRRQIGQRPGTGLVEAEHVDRLGLGWRQRGKEQPVGFTRLAEQRGPIGRCRA